MFSKDQEPTGDTHKTADRRPGTTLWRLLLPLAVLALAAGAAAWLMATGPQAKPRPKVRNATLVEVTEVHYGSHQVVLSAMGTVTPAREVEIKPRVSGEIIWLSPELLPGGLFQRGQTLLRIDPTDYELAVRQLTSDVAQGEADLKLEQGNQAIARREYELLGEVVNEEDLDLVLRKPQLETAQARLEAARAQLKKASLDLERTTIRAPFNAIIQSRQVNIGTRVSESTTMASLVGTDEYWVEVSVPVNQLQWIRLPRNGEEEGSLVRVYDQSAWGAGVYRAGRVVRLAADLEPQGRMARLLVRVEDPLGLGSGGTPLPRMLIGSYVRVEIDGAELDAVAALDRALIHNGDEVWVMGGDGKLDIRKVTIVYRAREQVLVSEGIASGERIVTTELAAPVEGMELRTGDRRGGARPSPEPGEVALKEGRP